MAAAEYGGDAGNGSRTSALYRVDLSRWAQEAGFLPGTSIGSAGASAQGQKPKSARLNGMSVVPSRADVVRSLRHIRFVPNPASKHARRCALRRRTPGNCEVFHIVSLLPEYNMSNSFS
jgi:hypothetical protein